MLQLLGGKVAVTLGGTGVRLAGTEVAVGVALATPVKVAVGLEPATAVDVAVAVLVAVLVAVEVAVLVAVEVAVATAVEVLVAVEVATGVLVAVEVAVEVLVGVAVAVGAPGSCRQAENSEVLPLGSVAVAVMNEPPGRAWSGWKVKVPLPLPRVVSQVLPMKVCPSPLPRALQVLLLNSSITKVVLCLLLRVPLISVALLVAPSTGKFCKLLGPVSASSASLAVTSSLPRLMPSLPLPKTELV
jgi:hypothetical protein